MSKTLFLRSCVVVEKVRSEDSIHEHNRSIFYLLVLDETNVAENRLLRRTINDDHFEVCVNSALIWPFI